MQGMNKLIKYYTKTSAIFILAMILAACEIIVPKEIKIKEEEVLAKYKDVPLKDVMNDVQKKFQVAKDEEMYFYSPNNYRTARTGLQVARGFYRDPEKRTYVLTNLYRADKALDDTVEVKKIVVRELSEHIKVRDVLDTLQAKKSHTREYRSLITSLVSIIEQIEKDKEEIFQDPERKKDMEEKKKDMMASLVDFRLRVVKFTYLNYGSQLIAEADSYDARSIAPVTYAQTIAARDSAVKYVTENVENLEGIADAARKFQFEAERLLQIARAVDTVLKLEKDSHEQYILKQEEYLQKIGNALKEPKLRYDSFPAQAAKYAVDIRKLMKENQDFALQIAELKTKVGDDSIAIAGAQAESEAANTGGADTNKDTVQGVEVVPLDGDPGQIKKSLRILTDQVYQLTVEKNSWESERAALQAQIKKLQASQKVEAKPAEKPAPKAKLKQPKAEAKKETKPSKTESKPESKNEDKTQSESKTENKAETKVETKAETKTDAAAKSAPESEKATADANK